MGRGNKNKLNNNHQQEELITVVDSTNRIIGAKPRSQITSHDIYRVAVLLIVDKIPPKASRVLLAQRALTKKHNPGKWGPSVAGTVPYNESYEQTIMRETREELGLMIQIAPNFPERQNSLQPKHLYAQQVTTLFMEDNGYRYFAGIFVLEYPRLETSQLNIDTHEVANVKWFSIKKIKSILNTDNSNQFLPVMNQLIKLLTSNN